MQEKDHLIIQGEITYSKYDDDMILDPRNIMKGKRFIRPDNAPEKRVELHLHTRFSALDALTDPAAVVKRAAYWGMPAIAVTDHGVAQAFPDMWKAGKKEGVKIIYGMEAYYLNDMDGNSAVIGKSSLPLDTEFVAFDIETTGLNAQTNRMTEIGAILFAGDRIIDTFNTFVDPQQPIPADITRLTGIRDSDVQGAPLEKEAMLQFMEFVGDRPIIAHNAHFDVGFMTAAARRNGLRFTPVFLDTLALSQALCPELKRFKLDIVSKHLGLPDFNHHRASDDALVVARMMGKFLPMLKQQGAHTVDDIESVYHSLRRTDVAKTYHMVLLVKNKTGLKNLYEMISQSYLKYFHRVPTIPKSLLLQHREGILVGSACGMGELYGAVMNGATQEELEKIAALYDYLEIQPICNNGFLVDNGRVKDATVLQDYNRTILNLGRRMGKPVIAASDVHFLDAEDEQYRKILQAAKKFSDADRDCPIFFRNTEEMLAEFAYLGEETAKEVVITNTRAIADQVDQIELLPKDLFAPKIENSAEDLKRLVFQDAPHLRRRAAGDREQARENRARHHSLAPLRRHIHERAEAGAELARARLPGRQPGQRGLVDRGLHVRHHGGQLPAAALCLPQVPIFRVSHRRRIRLRRGHARKGLSKMRDAHAARRLRHPVRDLPRLPRQREDARYRPQLLRRVPGQGP